VADDAGEEVATPGKLHHSRLTALASGTARIGDLLYPLQAEESCQERQQQHPVRKNPQNQTP
jgi:hypothetical protein